MSEQDEDIVQIDSNGEVVRSNVVESTTDSATGKTIAIHDSKGEY
jgi:hypothetical protein